MASWTLTLLKSAQGFVSTGTFLLQLSFKKFPRRQPWINFVWLAQSNRPSSQATWLKMKFHCKLQILDN
eukprot:1153832-Pelagomonas_calceolata.AAC.1